MSVLQNRGLVAFVLTVVMIACLNFNLAIAEDAPEEVAVDKKDVPEKTVDKMGVKLVRGIANAATGWLEIPRQVARSAEEDGPYLMLPLGIARGTIMTVARTSYGVIETAFFYMPFADGYNSVLKPAYVWKCEDDE